MNVPKIKGIETEWGAVVRSPNSYESADSLSFYLMLNAIRKFFSLPVLSRYVFLKEIENIERILLNDGQIKAVSKESGSDPYLRGFAEREEIRDSFFLDRFRDRERDRDIFWEMHSKGFLSNGARCYVDGPHIEYSTPECLSAKTLVAADKAGEIIINLARIAANKILSSEGKEIIIYKDTGDRKENSYGCHENYLVSRNLFDELTNPRLSRKAGLFISYMVARQDFTGSGGISFKNKGNERTFYQKSQRADFINRILTLDTVFSRGIINLRDEPHADWHKFGRLHIIFGDANLSEISTYLKVGVTSIILEMLEDDFIREDLILADPLRAIRQVSRDLSCKSAAIETRNGKIMSSLDLNWKFFENAKKYFESVREPNLEEKDLLLKWEETLSDFSSGNESRLRRRFDWKIKQDILENFLAVHGCDWQNADDTFIKSGFNRHKVSDQLFKKDLLYHNTDREKSLYWIRKEADEIEKLLDKDEVLKFVKNPPEDTRAYFRGKCLEMFSSQIEETDWEMMSFRNKKEKKNEDFLIDFGDSRRIFLTNPAWGKKEDVGAFFENESSLEKIFEELSKIK